jgi:heme exporter protein C
VIVTAVLFVVGLYFAFFNSPQDYQMGDTVRIMYVHVPNAWLSQFVYGVMTVSAVGTLVWRHPMADVSMKAAAPLGALFTALALFTGSLWGRPTWGTFWEWDGA